MRSISIPRRSHQTASLLRLNKACAEANGTPFVAANVGGQPMLFEKPLKYSESVIFSCGGKSLTGEKKTAGVIGDREWITILAVAKQELAFIVGAPQLVGTLP